MSSETNSVAPGALRGDGSTYTGDRHADLRLPDHSPNQTIASIVQVLQRIVRVRLAGASLVVIVIAVVTAAFANFIAPYNPNVQDYNAFMQGPSLQHIMGTDNLGRDVLSRVIFGSRVSLEVGVIAVGIASVIGVTIGLIAGYWGGLYDEVLMRIMDAVQAFPSLVLALAITAALGSGITKVMIAVGIVGIPTFARLTRGQVLFVRELPFVMAEHCVGASDSRIIIRHIFPNVTAPIIVQATLLIGGAIIAEASLSFLGVGVVPPTASWGSMLQTGFQYLEVAPWLSFPPGIAIFATVLAFNFLGDGLREALDPHFWRRS